MEDSDEMASVSGARAEPSDDLLATLGRQSASGLWNDDIEATIDALLGLLRHGLSTSHAVHGAQIRKAVDALTEAIARASALDAKLAELGLAVAWLLSTGRRTKKTIEDATRARGGLDALASLLGDHDRVRAHVERIAPVC